MKTIKAQEVTCIELLKKKNKTKTEQIIIKYKEDWQSLKTLTFDSKIQFIYTSYTHWPIKWSIINPVQRLCMINLLLTSMPCFIWYYDTARDRWILINYQQQVTQKIVGAFLIFFQLITNAVSLLMHKINSTVVKNRPGKVLECKIWFFYILI